MCLVASRHNVKSDIRAAVSDLCVIAPPCFKASRCVVVAHRSQLCRGVTPVHVALYPGGGSAYVVGDAQITSCCMDVLGYCILNTPQAM